MYYQIIIAHQTCVKVLFLQLERKKTMLMLYISKQILHFVEAYIHGPVIGSFIVPCYRWQLFGRYDLSKVSFMLT